MVAFKFDPRGPMRMLVIGALLVALSLSSCGSQAEPVVLATSLTREGDFIQVTGSSNLPDGSVISIYAWHQDVDDAVAPGFDASDVAAVSGGSFNVQIPIVGWPPGRVNVSASFSIGGSQPQPDHIVDAYGDHGERLTGRQVEIDPHGVAYLTEIRAIPIP